MNQPGWWDITGGKLTTYRLMAEEAVNAIARYTGVKESRCRTSQLSLLKGIAVANMSGILPPPISPDVVRHCSQHEWARHVDDVMIRRTSWRYYHHDHDALAEQVARWMAVELGWSSDHVRSELARYRQGCTASAEAVIVSTDEALTG